MSDQQTAQPVDDFAAFSRYERDFCDLCGNHLMKHDDGKCPEPPSEFMLEVKRRKAKKYVARD